MAKAAAKVYIDLMEDGREYWTLTRRNWPVNRRHYLDDNWNEAAVGYLFSENAMPNGGVPMHMVLTPSQESRVVLYCERAELHIFSKADWDAQNVQASPLAILTAEEGLVLERFLRYWLQDNRNDPLYDNPGVNAEFHF